MASHRPPLRHAHTKAAARRKLWWTINRAPPNNDTDNFNPTESLGFIGIYFENDQLIIACSNGAQTGSLVAALRMIGPSVLRGSKIITNNNQVTVTQPTDAILWNKIQEGAAKQKSYLTRQQTPYGLVDCITRIKSSLPVTNSAISAAATTPAP